MSYTPVIGLEIHVQLATESKLFCPCSTHYIGATPNTLVCPVCLGLPGALPVLNERAVDLAIRLSLALSCKILNFSLFHRKNYFYPDLPKAYQISQYDLPLAKEGFLEIEIEGHPKRIRITRLHLEEDAAKLVHETADGRLAGSTHSLVDYNRGGVPLVEIVSEPDIASPDEAREYVSRLRQLVRYLDVSDGDMESGSMRVDANISLARQGEALGSKVEVKNLNSLRALERALEYEIMRQMRILTAEGHVLQETRHWDDIAGQTRSSRSKEEAHDYRYFPEPDLPPLTLEKEKIEDIRADLPELPWEKKRRFIASFGLSEEEAALLTERQPLADYYERCVQAGADPLKASLWTRMEILRLLNELKCDLEEFPVTPRTLADLIHLLEKGDFSPTAAKLVLDVIAREKLTLEEAIEKAAVTRGKVTGTNLEEVVQAVFEEQNEVVKEILSGKDKKGAKRKFLEGSVMKKTKGQADPKEVSEKVSNALRVFPDVDAPKDTV